MLHVENLSFTYKGGQHAALRGVNFDIAQGEIFGFLGPSGAGKSTTQRILTKLLAGYQGRVAVMGKDLTAWGASYYENIGVSFELPNHYQKMSGLENLNFFRRLYAGETEDPMKLLELVGLKEDADVRVSQYSKGMQMRLNFARALINKPKLLMLDEPTSGLDPVNARQIKDIIMGLKHEGRTIFLATHNMAVADELCDRVAFIVDGQISTIESPRTLKIKWGQPLLRVEYRLNGHTEQRDYPLTGLAENSEFQQILARDAIETLHSREATLEDVFIKVTGRELA